MDWVSLIRRLRLFVRHHGWDSAFAVLLAVGVFVSGGPALAGLARFAGALSPGMAAQAADDLAHAGPGLARLPMFGFPGSDRYSPQVLFPVRTQVFPDWLLAHKPGAAPVMPAAHPVIAPVIAIVIDDLGEDLVGTGKAIALPGPVALSFLPYADATPLLAARAARKGHEILAHVPMEAVGATRPEPMALTVGASDIASRLAWNIARVPGLSGINNHEGSKFTADAASLTPVAQALAAKRLFFFDSRTGPESRVVPIAHMFGVASAGRDVFLDNVPTGAAVRQQLAELVAMARMQGVAIAIGHPHEQTLATLAAWLAEDHGVRLVPLAEAMRLKTQRQTLASR